jgi:predicted nucleic acid-binding Zn ribbon protein
MANSEIIGAGQDKGGIVPPEEHEKCKACSRRSPCPEDTKYGSGTCKELLRYTNEKCA